MNPDENDKVTFQKARQTAEGIKAKKPELAEPLEAFARLFEAFEAAEDALGSWDVSGLEVDKHQFVQGKFLLDMFPVLDFSDRVKQVCDIVLPACVEAFPALSETIAILQKLDGSAQKTDLATAMRSLLEGDGKAMDAVAEKLDLPFDVFGFVVSQLVAPVLRSQAKALSEHFGLEGWTQGYCPVCASLPSISYLVGDGGKRWMHCSSCGQNWRFKRQQCAACGEDTTKGQEYFFLEDKKDERAYTCKSCKKYLLTIDIREMTEKPNMNIVPLGLIPLDIKAQEKGYEPLTELPWNNFTEES